MVSEHEALVEAARELIEVIVGGHGVPIRALQDPGTRCSALLRNVEDASNGFFGCYCKVRAKR